MPLLRPMPGLACHAEVIAAWANEYVPVAVLAEP